MKKEFNWFRWYTPSNRIVSHIAFWLLVTLLYYLNYSRMGGIYIWLFIVKELFVTSTLFYSASWIIFKWVSKGRPYPLFVFIVFAYIWWVSCTYLTCYFVRFYIPATDLRFDRYLEFILADGFIGLLEPHKFSVLILDFIFMVSIPLAPKLVKSLLEDSLRRMKLERDNLAMELDFLKSQVSPHFLFNTLNNVYRMSEKADPEAPGTILRLSNLVRYSLYESKHDKIQLSKEIEFIRNYINLAKLRYSDHVPITIQISEIDEPYKIIPLILIPFVENAFKHGPYRSRNNSWVDISLHVMEGQLFFSAANGTDNKVEKPLTGGVGLQNTRRRLELYYPNRHQLQTTEKKNSYHVDLVIDLKWYPE